MWAHEEVPDRPVSLDCFLLEATAASGIMQVLPSSRSLEANWQQAASLVQSPLSSSSDGSATTSSTQSECPAISPKQDLKVLPHAPSSASTRNIYTSNCLSVVVENQESAMSSDWWASGEQHVSPWPSNYAQPSAAPLSSNGLAELEGGDWSPSQLAALAPGSVFSGTELESSSGSNVGWSSAMLLQLLRNTIPSESCMMEPDEMQAWQTNVAKSLGLVEPNHSMYNFDAPFHYALSQDESHSSRLLDLEAWPTSMADHSRRSINPMSLSSQKPYASSDSTDSFKFDTTANKIKQELPDTYYDRSSSVPLSSLSTSGKTNAGGDNAHLLSQANRPLLESFTSCELPQLHSFSTHDMGSQWGAHSSRLPTMLSQVLPYAVSRQSNPLGSTAGKILFESPPTRSDHLPFHRISEVISFTKSGGQTSATDSNSSGFSLLNRNMDEPDSEGRNLQNDKKRAMPSIAAPAESTSEQLFKRPRLDPTPTLPFKVRKEKLGEKITALQQLVSPFGKTDTASVLHEAIGYIRFLHEQVQVLSKPYMKSISMSSRQNEAGKNSWNSDKTKLDGEEPKQDLRSRGLCLVPVSCTQQITNDNGADYWTSPAIGGISR
ncbi:hypothetical protein O6H91_11G009500 [Diphasiastrum complanatum]|uniref:Uncharacterized protein n=3 Tax=Diphasiastrum complanatum TaxID=34168 RepID=A0ACC2C649_DIPCM|nr:hypothetical protein O6H91_11G007000 [Diphasiastrum complanatum]KAJ7537478.1 hypothetical protein O6H91_11G007000 [Diphasiastrum complanatum]KAJ7537523.1 hypothetical protein O6H91_11G009500 [Diphasiastrum complanatum]